MTEQDFKFVEFRIGYYNAGNLYEVGAPLDALIIDTLKNRPRTPIFRSIAVYDNDAIEYVKKKMEETREGKPSLAGYQGIIWPDYFIIDIDNSDLNASLAELKFVLGRLRDDFKVDFNHIQVAFSGSKGFHINIPREMLGFSPSKHHYKQCREFMFRLFGPTWADERTSKDNPSVVASTDVPSDNWIHWDHRLYKPNMPIRWMWSVNEKSGLFKIPVNPTWVLAQDNINNILDLAKTRQPGSRLDRSAIKVNDELAKLWPSEDDLKRVEKTYRYLTHEDLVNLPVSGIPMPVISSEQRMCMTKLANEDVPAGKGMRNESLLRLAAHEKWLGTPPLMATAKLRAWNDALTTPILESEFTATVNSALSNKYFFKCDDAILAARCDERCILYEKYVKPNKDGLTPDIFDTVESLSRDYTKNRDLGICTLGIPELDRLCYGLPPGETAMMIGRSGVGKTTLMLYMALNIQRAAKRPVLIIEQELGKYLLFQKCMSLVLQVPMEYIDELYEISKANNSDGFKNLVQEAKEKMDGVHFMTLDHLTTEAKIKCIELFKLQHGDPAMVFEDHLSRSKGIGSNAYEKASELGKGLKHIAKTCNVAYFCLGQVHRGDDEDQSTPLNMSSVRGSGEIEEGQDLMFGLHRPKYQQSGDDVITIQILKGRRGNEGYSFDLKWDRKLGTFEVETPATER